VNGQAEVWYDGNRIESLSKTESLGTTPIGRIQLGENSSGRTFDVAFDDVVVDTAFISDPSPPDTTQPTAPTGLAATTVTSSSVDLAWSASTDNVAVTGYTIYRNGQEIGTVGSTTLTYQDVTVAPGTSYTYTVDAFDAAGNHSPPSNAAAVTTPPPPSSFGLNPIADSYVRADNPSSNFGTSSTLRADASPETRSYLRFDVQGIVGTITSAKLRLYANSSSSTGYQVRGVTDNTWAEGTITYANSPAIGSVVGSSGAFSSGAYVEVDVTPLVTGNGTLSLAVTTTSNSSMNFGSRQSTNQPQLVINQSTGPDSEDPTTPTNLTASAVDHARVDLSWSAATDNVAVTGYTVYRDGQEIDTVDGTTLTYQDVTVQPSTSYTYTVDAFDATGNHSPPSNQAAVTTPSVPTSITLTPTADAYVRSDSPSSNFGTSSTLRADASPDIRSYLRFDVQGAVGTITSAKLRLYANSSSSTGHQVSGVADSTWTEAAITYANAPAIGSVVGSSGAFSSGAYVEVDVTPLVTGNGTLSLAVTTTSNTSISYASRQAANQPQLVLEMG
jgi:chitodextrinase